MNPNLAALGLLLFLPSSLQTNNPDLAGYILSTADDGTKVLHLKFLQIEVRLKTVRSLVSPRYSMVVRNGSKVSVNRTLAFPTCLYEGSYVDAEYNIKASVSTCTDEILATIELNGVHYTLENEKREKREAAGDFNEDQSSQILMIKEPSSKQECGLNKKNRKRLRVEERPVFRLKRDVPLQELTTQERYIELSVFVDDRMYSGVENNKKSGENTLQKIQDIVFAYLNAVQIIYKSDRLTNKLRLVLVRLDVMQVPDSSLDSSQGEIESYLDAFCNWQQAKNPSSNINNGDIVDDEHWDHALLLTGYNLFDTTPDRDSVIGLAWVSGMCHPDYSCTINEGNNFESVYVIAHEMGHNLGMNHDGESIEGNTCSPDNYLMSPVLGPGKVSWSTCSDQELNTFLTDIKTRGQAACLDDVPTGVLRYDFSLNGKKPGDIFPAIEQCRQAFGPFFNPYVKEENPFEDLCRELWCSNLTHALRAHPALEGTDCSSKPYPFGSICVEGTCSPFDPNSNLIPVQPIESFTASSMPTQSTSTTEPQYPDPQINFIDDTPDWYDPIYTKVFTNLRRSYELAHPILFLSQSTKNTKVSQMLAEDHRTVNLVEDAGSLNLTLGHGGGAVWQLYVDECPVPCGGGWAGVTHLCQFSGEAVDQSFCEEKRKPLVNKLPCGTLPCNSTIGILQRRP